MINVLGFLAVMAGVLVAVWVYSIKRSP